MIFVIQKGKIFKGFSKLGYSNFDDICGSFARASSFNYNIFLTLGNLEF
jgi:hypothetical protein